ncbi:hypothetical protein [Nocardia sp. NPDC004604]|uniref:hypothetical protein n=1 Tax=Nocardia sp. NPDC004604 TaxID=3157013 RepID=UPI0033A7047E
MFRYAEDYEWSAPATRYGLRMPMPMPMPMPRPKARIRTRIFAIALIPSVALFAIGMTVAGYLLRRGENVKTWSSVLADANRQAGDMINAIQQERLLSLIRLTTSRPDPVALGQARTRLDTTLAQLTSLESALMKTSIGLPTGDIHSRNLSRADTPGELGRKITGSVTDYSSETRSCLLMVLTDWPRGVGQVVHHVRRGDADG